MDMKRLIYILIGLVLISFGAGALSLRYNDDFSFEDMRWNTINIGGHKNIKINSTGIEVKDGDEGVIISWDGIKVNDGKDKVSIGWDGIKIDDGNDKVTIGWGGINIQENNKSKTSRDLKWMTIDKEEFIKIDGIKNIGISSTFVDIKISSMDRDDIMVKYSGEMESNVVPKLKINERSGEIGIEIENDDKNIFPIRKGDISLQVFIPKTYSGNLNIAGVSSVIDIKNLLIEDLNVASISGDIEIEHISGRNINIGSNSGNIDIEDSIGEMNLLSSSGNIKLDNKENNEDVKINSSSGDVSIEFGKDSNYTIVGKSSSGEFITTFSMDIEEKDYKKFKGVIGSGKNTMEINTLSGDVQFIKE